MTRLARSLIRAVVAVGLGLAAASGPALAQQTAGEEGKETLDERAIQVKILGMSCPFCAYGVEQKLKKLEGVEELEVELETGLATLTMAERADISNEVLRKVVDRAGFEAAAIVRNFDSDYEAWNPGEIP